MEGFRLLLDHLLWIEHQFLSDIRDSRTTGSLWGMMRCMGGERKSIHQSWLAKGLGLELGLGLLCWGFKGFQEEITSEEANTLQIRSVALPPGQCNSQQLHPCHRLYDQDGHQDTSSASLIVQTLLPVTFGYSLRSEAVVMRQLKRWKRLWQRSLTGSHKRTSMEPPRSCCNHATSALQPEEITSKGTSFMCVLSIKVPIRKKSGNLWHAPRIYTSSSSSCLAGSTDIPYPLSPLFPIVHRLRQVFRTTSCILT